ncbi:hypothetical protein [Streptomyces sp. NK08204]|uniref:hypothetical protein n=1 Tax=Streptomyces sp. NK08204 TaxID=2873260 RepID=UPI001CED0895|nr:hypothetical protein [Streptomyces sp. NK08204]
MTTRQSRASHHAMSAIAAIALLATLSACSKGGQERQYSVPNSLCGTPVDAKELAPFMPPGRKVSVEQEVDYGFTRTCRVSVDSKRVMETTDSWWEAGKDTADFMRGQTVDAVDHEADNGRYLYSGNEAFAKTHHCASKQLMGNELFTAIQMRGSSHKDTQAMKRLIVNYTKAIEKTDTCKDGKPFA